MLKYRDKKALNILYHVQGLSSERIAEKFGVTRSCICQWMRRLGVEPRSLSERQPKIEWSLERKAKASKMMTGKNNHMFGVKTSDEVKAKQSKSKLGDKNPNYGKKFSEEHKQKIGEVQTGEKNHSYGLRGELSPNYGKEFSQERKDNISKANKGVPRVSEKRKKEMSIQMMGKGNHQYGKSPSPKVSRGKGGRFTDRKGRTFFMRSSWELAFATWLDERGFNWDYECKRFDLGFCTYTPDFWVEEMGGWIEIKGYYDEASMKKTMAFRDLYPEENLMVATKEILERYPNLNIDRRYAKDAVMSIA